MNYEDFLAELSTVEKSLKDLSSATTKCTKNLSKVLANGDLRSAIKELNNLQNIVGQLQETQVEAENKVKDFDANEYFASGNFTANLLDLGGKQNINIIGEFPIYEIFPNKLRIDIESNEVILDKKRFFCLRPKSLIDTIANNQEKLRKAPFNANGFINELVEVYDLMVIKKQQKSKNIQSDADVLLKEIYTAMIPMSRFRKEYDLQAFAFDLARMIELNPVTKDGRTFSFGTKRDNNGLRILDNNGKERWLELIRFYRTEQ